MSAGFDFLCYRLSPNGITIAKTSQTKMQQKVQRLYEQGASTDRIARYLERWLSWVKAGLGDCIQPSLEPLTQTIHSIYKAVEIAKNFRLTPVILQY